MDLVLASTSPYRRTLLERLQLPFRCVPPGVDEQPAPGETPEAMAGRLALAKAAAVAADHRESLVIGSDQVASLDGVAMGKPGEHEAAVAQLRACAGREVTFYTGLALLRLEEPLQLLHVEPFRVRFRPLQDSQIDAYLRREQPYDCAGSFKVEGLGIGLFESLQGDDPSSLEGLPLITLTHMLAQAGVDVLTPDPR